MIHWLSPVYVRSVPGQLNLLTITFVGAIGLALATILVRDRLFEPYIQEQFAENPQLTRLAEDLATGRAGIAEIQANVDHLAQALLDQEMRLPGGNEPPKHILEKIRAKARNQVVVGCYGHWLMHPGMDDHLLLLLLQHDPEKTHYLLKRSLVVGNVSQQARALAGTAMAGEFDPAEAARLARFAQTRALRRGQTELAQLADKILHKLRSKP